MFLFCSREVNAALVPISRSFNLGDDQMDLSATIRRAIEIGDQHGFITFDQIDELLPSSVDRPEEIESLLNALSDQGIDVREA
jgi:hypothetical protein